MSCDLCGAEGGVLEHFVHCPRNNPEFKTATTRPEPLRVAVFEPMKACVPEDVEFQVLIRCVSELNRLTELGDDVAARVVTYLYDRFSGK